MSQKSRWVKNQCAQIIFKFEHNKIPPVGRALPKSKPSVLQKKMRILNFMFEQIFFKNFLWSVTCFFYFLAQILTLFCRTVWTWMKPKVFSFSKFREHSFFLAFFYGLICGWFVNEVHKMHKLHHKIQPESIETIESKNRRCFVSSLGA